MSQFDHILKDQIHSLTMSMNSLVNSADTYALEGNDYRYIFKKQMSKLLSEISREKKCLFVFSVDFSHYLEPNETDRRDMETRKAVLSGDLDSINRMTDANVDSYRCLGAFVRLCEGLGGEIRELDHSNSMEITDIPYDKVTYSEGLTSYFIFAGETE